MKDLVSGIEILSRYNESPMIAAHERCMMFLIAMSLMSTGDVSALSSITGWSYDWVSCGWIYRFPDVGRPVYDKSRGGQKLLGYESRDRIYTVDFNTDTALYTQRMTTDEAVTA